MADAPTKRRALNPRQEAFVREYLVDRVAGAAARRAGYGAPETCGPRLLKNAQVQSAIAQYESAQAERLRVKADDVISEIKRLAFSDLADIFDENGALRPMKDIPLEARRAIAGVEVVERYRGEDEAPEIVRKVKLWDKPKALDQLARHLSLYHDKVELSVDDGLGALLQAALAPGKPTGGQQ